MRRNIRHAHTQRHGRYDAHGGLLSQTRAGILTEHRATSTSANESCESLGRLGGDGHTLRPVALAVEPHPRAPVIQMTILDIQPKRLTDPRTGQQQQTAQGIRPRIHTARFDQKKPCLLAGEVRTIRMTVQFRSAHMLARIAVDISLLAEVAVEAAYDAQIPRVCRGSVEGVMG